MEDTQAGRNGESAQNHVLVVQEKDYEHARIQDQNMVVKIVPNLDQHIKSSDVTHSLALLMVVILLGHLGRNVLKHVVAAPAHAVAHVLNRPQHMVENPVLALDRKLSQKVVE